jgi:beta-lactamase regulating signal transducer with metallopeptidase domain
MTAIEHLLREPAAQAIGWALLHFVWQGTLIGVLTALALAALRKGAADVRYVVAAIGLSLMVTLPAVTAIQLWRSATLPSPSIVTRDTTVHVFPASTARPGRVIGDRTVSEAAPSGSRMLESIRIEPWLPMLVLTWLTGVVILSLRLMSSWVWVQRIKTHGTSPAADGWDHIAERLCRRLHIARRVRLLESTIVDVPTVIGWMKPVILMPASALAGLNPHQLEAILAHELAHIRRHDYLVNLLQTVVETLLFYHPAVWWLSGRIRAERENCCDDLAVSLCGDPYTYAQALADLEELRTPGRPFAMAASGGSLVQRVRRLLGAPSHAGRAPGWLAGSASVLVFLGLAAGTATDAFQSAGTPAVRPSVAAPTSASTAPVIAEAPVVADQVSTPPVSTPPSIPPRSDKAAALAGEWTETNRARQALTAEREALLRRQDHAAAVFAEDRLFPSTPAALPMIADATRTMAALDAAWVASTPVVARTASVQSVSITGGQSHGTFSWSNNGEKLEVRYDGEVEFTDDDTDVKSLSPGGLLRIRDGGMMTSLLGGRTIEFRSDSSGKISRRFWVGSSERPFEPEGHKWLTSVLPRFIRQTGIGASARVARILKQKGPSGVLTEISLIEGSWAKRRYFSELLKTTTLDAATTRQALVQAGREMDSDFELASFLIDNADKLLVDDATRQAYFDASRSIDSDFEMRRAFSAALKRGPVPPAMLVSMLNASHNIDSDFELASLLIDVARLQPLDNTTRPAFFSALDTVQSDFEHRRVLSTLAGRGDLTPETSAAMLLSGASVDSDFEAATFLLELAKRQPIEGNVRAPFFRAVDSISSSFERGRVLQAVAKRPDASPDTILAVLRASSAMGSNFETSQVLLAVVSTHAIDGPARDAYIATAEKLGDFEQGRTLSALVKSERRK